MPATAPPLAEYEWQLIAGAEIPPAAAAHGLELVSAGDFEAVFRSPPAQALLGAGITDAAHPDVAHLLRTHDYPGYIQRRLSARPDTPPAAVLAIGIAALWSFIQANVTGPPLPFAETLLLPPALAAALPALTKAAIAALAVDGESAYHLTPKALLLSLALTLLNAASPLQTAPWWRLRANFTHQKVLSEPTETLHNLIYADLAALAPLAAAAAVPAAQSRLLIEKALIDTFFSHDATALTALEAAAATTGLQYALTGVLGKRTKFQQTSTSQLVVLALSTSSPTSPASAPLHLPLNDDTLLESISFTPTSTSTTITSPPHLPPALASLDPASQPPLAPLDAAILLLITETIKNTNPSEGLTREEMMPYATRVLQHPTNWEIYTLALLTRSKLEGYRSRTIERGLLQLQAVVDQVIADTTPGGGSSSTTTFLPRAKEDEAAPVKERLRYIHQLSVPTRWALEAELAARWIAMGGLRTALEIYERLEMWAEVALCWAATEKEEKARGVVRGVLFRGEEEVVPAPQGAARLWCILGDLEGGTKWYERAWEVSGGRYARAKRSLGRYYFAKKKFREAAEAYGMAVRVNALNGPSWFALGCCWLEVENWEGAVEAFTRAVGIDEGDAEAWSNLATALLRRGTVLPAQKEWREGEEQGEEVVVDERVVAKEGNKRNALTALKRASTVKYDSWRIWENLLVVAASVTPPSYGDVVIAMKRIIALRGESAGEGCVDVDVLEMLVRHVITSDLESDVPRGYDPSKPGLSKMVVELMEKDVTPLITGDARLWKLVGKLALWRKKPRDALDAEEKAWRAVSSRPGVTDTKGTWEELVEATVELVGAYESLGEMEREGLGGGEVVAKDWRFKARSCVRGVMGRGKDSWEDSKGWERLRETLEGLKL